MYQNVALGQKPRMRVRTWSYTPLVMAILPKMVKENWSLTKEQNKSNETEIIKQTNKTSNSSNDDVGSVQNPIQNSTTTNVWGEYVSKSNLIDLHFC